MGKQRVLYEDYCKNSSNHQKSPNLIDIHVSKPLKRGNLSSFHKNSVQRNRKKTLLRQPHLNMSDIKISPKPTENSGKTLNSYSNDQMAALSAVYYQVISPTMDRRPRLNVLTNNKNWIRFLVDTGAAKCCIDRSLLPNDAEILSQDTQYGISTASGPYHPCCSVNLGRLPNIYILRVQS